MCNYFGKGYHVFVDNFFSSIALMKNLYSRQTFITGTTRRNRKGLPSEVKEKTAVGQPVYYKNGNHIAMAYRQKKTQKYPVILLSSKGEVGNADITNRRHGRVTRQTKPKIIANYNSYMGGIDHFDMMLYTYLDERRTVKYWKKVAFNIFCRMILNCYVMYKDNCINHNVKPSSRYKFIVSIVESIAEEWFIYKNADHMPGGGGDNSGPRSLEKIAGTAMKTCWVCTEKGQGYKTSRKRSRLACSRCKEGCHGTCFARHVCK